MKKAKRILLLASIVAMSFSAADASLFGGRKAAKKPAAPTAEAASVSLTSIEIEGERVVLRTKGSAAYTSYSPEPAVFVVDLSSATKAADLSVPTELPPALLSIAAEEAVEMGNRLTRVTFRLARAIVPEVAAAAGAVTVTLPASSLATSDTVAESAPAAALPAPAPVDEPVVVSEPLDLPKAKTLKRVEASTAGGAIEVRLTADGAIDHNAFLLESPPRLVIDLNGVRNGVAKNTVAVSGGPLKRVRVAQFKTAPAPVTRVVVDLDRKSEYTIIQDGAALRVAFSGSKAPAASVAAVEPRVAEEAKKSEPAAAKTPLAEPAKLVDIPERVPVVAENASSWRMPEQQSVREAKTVIRSGDTQVPPVTTTPTTQPRTTTMTTQTPAPGTMATNPPENVFTDPAVDQGRQGQVLTGQASTGGRTLSPGQRVYTGEPISLSLKDADIRDVLRTFAQLTGLNIAVDPQVSGTVTVDFVEVPWDQALDIILRQNGLTFVLEGNVMRIGTIERLAAETAATRRLAEEERLNVPLQTVVFKLSYARATEVAVLLRELASPRARIIVDARTNQLIVTEIPQFLQTMSRLIEAIDVPTRQVVIEARIVEASKVFQQAWGFEWGFRGVLDPAVGTGTGLIFPNRIGFEGGPFRFTGGAPPVFGITLTDVLGTFNLDLALNASEFEGLVKVISAPKVMTQDNTAAEIQSGFQIPYQTRVNFTTTVTYVDATLRLSVTPQITEAGTVIMEIQLQKNEPTTGLAIEGAAGTPLSTRQARTKLMVRDGGTAVIGGIYQVKENRGQSRVPFLHQIPVLGNLFRSHSISSTHDELLIFITPRIVRGA